MSTDFQRAREALGVRLREMRAEGGLTGRELADRLGWTQSKVSKLETGKQTATADDLQTWAEGAERPEAAEELKARLRGLESRSRSWRRQLAAGHRSVQDTLSVEYERSTVLRAWEGSMIVGVLQTAEYARHVFSGYVDLHQSPRDIADAVRARLKRQETLYQPGKRYRIVMWEAALRALICPPAVLAAQLDRLNGIVGLDTLSLGIVPFGAAVKIRPGSGHPLRIAGKTAERRKNIRELQSLTRIIPPYLALNPDTKHGEFDLPLACIWALGRSAQRVFWTGPGENIGYEPGVPPVTTDLPEFNYGGLPTEELPRPCG